MNRWGYVALILAAFASTLPLALVLGEFALIPLVLFGALGLAGAVSPNAVNRVSFLRWASIVATICFGSCGIYSVGSLIGSRRRPVQLVVDSDAPGIVRVVYGVADADKPSWKWERTITIPANGIAHVPYGDIGTHWSGNPHPVRAQFRYPDGRTRDIPVSWVGGGYAENGTCHWSYDEYVIGKQVDAATLSRRWLRTGWLDSLNSWGIGCRDGKLYRGVAAEPEHMMLPSQRCYTSWDGSVSCVVLPGRPLKGQ